MILIFHPAGRFGPTFKRETLELFQSTKAKLSSSINEAEFELRNISLIRIHEETGMIFIHRQIQAAFFDRLAKDQRENAFKAALPLLRKGPPWRRGHFHPYARWQSCEQLRQPALALRQRYQILRKAGFSEQVGGFTRLMCDTAW